MSPETRDVIDYLKGQMGSVAWERVAALDPSFDPVAVARIWPSLVDAAKRQSREIPFLQSVLAGVSQPAILDACLGSGATSIGLKAAGFKNVVSNEVDASWVTAARDEALRQGVTLDTESLYWHDLPVRHRGQFDAVTCLGNSITYLFKPADQAAALRGFFESIKPGGVLVIDQRNYPEIARNHFKWSGEVVYCGTKNVQIWPRLIDPEVVVLEYRDRHSGERVNVAMYPWKEGELEGMLVDAGFRNIETYGDYKSQFDRAGVEFFTFIAHKPLL